MAWLTESELNNWYILRGRPAPEEPNTLYPPIHSGGPVRNAVATGPLHQPVTAFMEW